MKIKLNNIETDLYWGKKVPNVVDENRDNTFGTILFTGIAITGLFFVSNTIATYSFFGLLTLGGFIAITESIRPLKYIIVRHKNAIDILIFTGTIYCIATAGVTVAATLTIAGLGYTLIYKPILINH